MPKKPKKKPSLVLVPGVHYFAEWILARGKTQEEVADAIGTNKSTVSRWCSGTLPELHNVLKLAKVLEVDPNDLFHHPAELWLIEKYRAQDDKGKQRLTNVVTNAFPD